MTLHARSRCVSNGLASVGRGNCQEGREGQVRREGRRQAGGPKKTMEEIAPNDAPSRRPKMFRFPFGLSLLMGTILI